MNFYPLEDINQPTNRDFRRRNQIEGNVPQAENIQENFSKYKNIKIRAGEMVQQLKALMSHEDWSSDPNNLVSQNLL